MLLKLTHNFHPKLVLHTIHGQAVWTTLWVALIWRCWGGREAKVLRTGLREDIPERSRRTSGSWLLGEEEERFSRRYSLDKGIKKETRGPVKIDGKVWL